MATQKDIAQFFRLALRMRLVDTAAIERWTDSVISAEPIARYPFTELASASRLPSATVEELLDAVHGEFEPKLQGRMVIAFLRRRISDVKLAPEHTIESALDCILEAPLTDQERSRVEELEGAVWFAMKENHGDWSEICRRIDDFLNDYAKFDHELPIST